MKTATLSKSIQHGFTLIELVSIMVLIGIVSVTVVPRFMGAGGFSEYAVRDQIISAARMAQQRAMYDQSLGACYRLNIASGVISAQRLSGGNYDPIGPTEEWRNGIAVEPGVTAADATVYFDGLGNALDAATPDCGGAASDITISVSGESAANVCITSVGYIRAC